MTEHRAIGKHMVAQQAGDQRWLVGAKRGELLGQVVYHEAWRQWEFVPAVNTAFTWDCLQAMSAFLQDLNKRGKP